MGLTRRWRAPGLAWLSPLFLVVAVAAGVLPLLAFGLTQGGHFKLDHIALRIAGFTLWQAGISTVLSVVPAIPLSRAIARRNFVGRDLLLSLFTVPLSMPAIVAVLSILTLYGASGALAGVVPVYGIWGIVLTHVFFNLPLATVMMHRALMAAAPESHRLAAQLGFADTAVFRNLDWPALRPVVPHVTALVFLLCAASFVVVLTLGGPSATTLEVAIYHSLRVDFDVGRAFSLSFLQVGLSLTLVTLIMSFSAHQPADAPLRAKLERFDGRPRAAKMLDGTLLCAAALLVLPPLAALMVEGVWQFTPSLAMAEAFATSLAFAVASALLAVTLAWGMAQFARQERATARIAAVLAMAGLVLPPAVMAMGWFLATRNMSQGVWLAASLIVLLNAIMALPFSAAAITTGFVRLGGDHERLCQAMGLAGWNRTWIIDLPALRPQVLQSLLLAFALSFGDLTAITLLGNQGIVTLPSLIAEQMGHFQSRQAIGTALLLGLLCFLASWVSQRIGEAR